MAAAHPADHDVADHDTPDRSPLTRIMYLECKADGFSGGPARIGRVTFSRSRRTLRYGDQQLRRLPGGGYKANHYDVATGEA